MMSLSWDAPLGNLLSESVDQLKRYLVTAGSWALLYINLQHVASVDNSSIMFSVLVFSQNNFVYDF